MAGETGVDSWADRRLEGGELATGECLADIIVIDLIVQEGSTVAEVDVVRKICRLYASGRHRARCPAAALAWTDERPATIARGIGSARTSVCVCLERSSHGDGESFVVFNKVHDQSCP